MKGASSFYASQTCGNPATKSTDLLLRLAVDQADLAARAAQVLRMVELALQLDRGLRQCIVLRGSQASLPPQTSGPQTALKRFYRSDSVTRGGRVALRVHAAEAETRKMQERAAGLHDELAAGRALLAKVLEVVLLAVGVVLVEEEVAVLEGRLADRTGEVLPVPDAACEATADRADHPL